MPRNVKRQKKSTFQSSTRTCPQELLDSIAQNTPKNGRVLEIGSGKGELAIQLRKMGFNIVATDLDHQALRFARKNHPKLPVIESDAHLLPFKSKAFDSVISIELIEHLHDVDEHLEEVRRVIKSSGWYFLKTPNKLLHDVFFWITRLYPKAFVEKEHLSVMSLINLKQKLRGHKFKITFLTLNRIQSYQIEKVVNRVKSKGLKRLIGKSFEAIPLLLLPAVFQPSLIFIAKKVSSPIYEKSISNRKKIPMIACMRNLKYLIPPLSS